ncbi:MAG: VOC family protein, partial [Chloroflexota bacterium]|nr:VOC family protein [Chloroflexota bacterium]
FYADVLGMRIAGRTEREGEFVEQVLAFPGAHIKGGFVDMGEGHQLELIQYLSPASGENHLQRNDLGASHLAFFVEDLDKFYEETSRKGIKYNNLPATMVDENGKLSRKAAYAQDPDGNWLEFVEIFLD